MKYKNLKVIAGAFTLSSLVLVGCNQNNNEKINNEQPMIENTIDNHEEQMEITNSIEEIDEEIYDLECRVEELDDEIEDLKEERSEILQKIDKMKEEKNIIEKPHPLVINNELLRYYDDVIDDINLNDGFIKTEEEFNYVLDRIAYNRKKNNINYRSDVMINTLNLEKYSDETKQKLNKFLVDLGEIDELSAIGLSLKDISFLQNTDIRGLDLTNNKITDIEVLSTVKNLHYLTLDNNKISDLSPLDNNNELYSLSLVDNNITDLTPLSNKTSLERLQLDYNNLSDLTPLSLLINLKMLRLDYNNITSLHGLQNMQMLEDLSLRGNNIKDVSSIIPIIEKNDVFIIFDGLEEENISAIEDVCDDEDKIWVYKIK